MAYAPATGYERSVGDNPPGNKGPLRFEEGVVLDTDVPQQFSVGAYGDNQGDGAGHNRLFVKSPEETMRERAHPGSASWIDAPTVLSEFVQGAQSDHPTFERVQGSETRLIRPNAAQVG